MPTTASELAGPNAAESTPTLSFQPVAMVLAFLLPGAGHAFLGEIRRGLAIAGGVLSLFALGLFVGGIDSVDSGNAVGNRVAPLVSRFTGKPPETFRSEADPIWFMGQAFVGPIAFAVDFIHQSHFKVVVRQPDAISDPSLQRPAFPMLRAAHPYEIRDPVSGGPVRVRDPRTGAALEFLDPATGTMRPSTPADRPPKVKSQARMEELGTLMCTVAGLMNLIAIVDASWNRRRRRPTNAGARS
jgi:hypothetical protein